MFRPLPYFHKYDIEPESRGFIKSSFLEGLKPIEYFYHCYSGREGIIDTAIKSVVYDTPIVIIENGISKYVKIGEWIDALLKLNQEDVKHYPNDRNMELLNLDSEVYVPSGDNDGNVDWHKVSAITKHDPSERLYEIKTYGGKHVIAAESETLLIWDDEQSQFKPVNSD